MEVFSKGKVKFYILIFLAFIVSICSVLKIVEFVYLLYVSIVFSIITVSLIYYTYIMYHNKRPNVLVKNDRIEIKQLFSVKTIKSSEIIEVQQQLKKNAHKIVLKLKDDKEFVIHLKHLDVSIDKMHEAICMAISKDDSNIGLNETIENSDYNENPRSFTLKRSLEITVLVLIIALIWTSLYILFPFQRRVIAMNMLSSYQVSVDDETVIIKGDMSMTVSGDIPVYCYMGTDDNFYCVLFQNRSMYLERIYLPEDTSYGINEVYGDYEIESCIDTEEDRSCKLVDGGTLTYKYSGMYIKSISIYKDRERTYIEFYNYNKVDIEFPEDFDKEELPYYR